MGMNRTRTISLKCTPGARGPLVLSDCVFDLATRVNGGGEREHGVERSGLALPAFSGLECARGTRTDVRRGKGIGEVDGVGEVSGTTPSAVAVAASVDGDGGAVFVGLLRTRDGVVFRPAAAAAAPFGDSGAAPSGTLVTLAPSVPVEDCAKKKNPMGPQRKAIANSFRAPVKVILLPTGVRFKKRSRCGIMRHVNFSCSHVVLEFLCQQRL